MVEIALLCVVVFQQVYWAQQVQKLINKLMSKNYYDYKFSDTIKAREEKPKKTDVVEFHEDTTATLSGIFG
jgi:hypothetical protein